MALYELKYGYKGTALYYYYYRIAVFSIEVLKDERIVIIAEQRPDCPEEEVNSLTFTHFLMLNSTEHEI